VVRPYPYDRLPRLPRGYAEVARLVRTHLGGEASAAWARWIGRYLPGGEARAPELVAVEPVSPGTAEVVRASPVVLGLQSPAGRPAFLALDGGLTSALLSMLLRSEAAPLTPPLTEAERGLVIYVVAAALHELGESGWSVLASTPEPDLDPAEHVVLRLRARLAGRVGHAALALPRALLDGAPTGGPRRRRLARLRWVVGSAAVELARLRLAAGELELLAEGDVIVSAELPPVGPALAGLLRMGWAAIPVVASGERLEVRGSLQLGGGVMDSTDPQSSALSVAEGLPVELRVELGRLTLSAAELLELEPGDALALGRPVGGAVDLRVGDRLVARGELVEVEGEVGVRVLEVFD